MHPIIYDVAVSIDGYVSGPGGDISKFAHDGKVVEDYGERLAGYAAAIMGRNTYEFGYRFGMKPGDNPYAHMATHVFSRSIELPDGGAVSVHRTCTPAFLERLKAEAGGPVYLCGGGAFAGSLLAMGLVDFIRLKRAPIILGGGVALFGGAAVAPGLRHLETRRYDDGYLLQEFAVLN